MLKEVLYNGKKIPLGSFIETFKYKELARNYVLTRNMRRAWNLTFKDDPELEKLIGSMDAVLKRPEVQIELEKVMPLDESLFKVWKNAIEAPTDSTISWSDKYKFWRDAMIEKGYLSKENVNSSPDKVTNVLININPALEKIYGEVIREVPSDGEGGRESEGSGRKLLKR